MLKCVIFDMDGTIGDTLPFCVVAFRRTVEYFQKRKLSDEEIFAAFGPSDEGTLQMLIPEHFDEAFSMYLQEYQKLHWEMCPQPFDGVRELLDLLKDQGLRLALVTGKGLPALKITLNVFQMENIFDAIEIGSPTGPNKPVGLRNVLQKLNLQPHEAIYIGDAITDITATKSVSIPIISAAWASTAEIERQKANQPDKICFSIAELKEELLSRILR
ncbi:MAG: HAD family hydrolase [Planctomycetaceae bacterium]|jgi:phosphoglycolate phosphatase/pyrophosphatase PpaX|nr:HAD family hydrolase [Planctomycetaceae bacterium]